MINFNVNTRLNIFIAIVTAIIYFMFNYILIANGHFDEDAFILFIYVENLLNGHGITFYPGGPHLEGATDFLWFVMLFFLAKLGLTVGTSAILLNTIGVFIISYIFVSEVTSSKVNNTVLYFLYAIAIMWIVQRPLPAAVGGFSVYLYMALVLLAFVSVYKEKYIQYTPYISLILALFRPDGVIIGVGFTLIGFFVVYKQNKLRSYIIGIAWGTVIGTLYFVWRYYYFGNLLPLPLLVKSHGSLLAGFVSNKQWVVYNIYFLVPLLILSLWNKKFKYYLFLIFSGIIPRPSGRNLVI